MIDPFEQAYVLTGPTGSGKTELSLALAEHLHAEIISMDSMALYRGMDIGTAKPTLEQRQRVPHHLIDVLDPWESSSVAWWLEQAAKCCRDIQERGRQVLLVGGTPLYVKALLHGLFPGPPADETLRRRLEEEAHRFGAAFLHDKLKAVDLAAAKRIHPNDLRRIVRALEVWELTGRPISSWQQQWRQAARPNPRCVWLDVPRKQLYANIDARVVRMFDAGLVAEVERLYRSPRPISKEASQALGYKEVVDYLEGRASIDETIARVQTSSRNFAKRQLTWFRHLSECQPIRKELTISIWGLTIRTA
ncbi:MAG: tRNA dimethylallyltransferase [Gemmatales bacterium]|nr:MAG: tRNA dimethylallyltransferase [Gemmatales bacterium]